MADNTTHLTVPIAAADLKTARSQILAAVAAGADMVELRTDYLRKLKKTAVKALLEFADEKSLPAIVTCRDKAQGGQGDWPLDLRCEILTDALALGASFIDCEYVNFKNQDVRDKITFALAANPAAKLILSAHDFDGPFDDVETLYQDIKADCPIAIPKLVYTAKHINDCFAAFDLLHNKDGDAIVLCMSEAGMISRVLAGKLGGFVTFAAIDDEHTTADGQLTIAKLKSLYRWDSLDSDAELFGVIGSPIGHSLSPAIFNACFDKQCVNALYLPLKVDGDQSDFNEFMKNVTSRPWLGFRGFSVTIPHKAHAVEYAGKEGGSLEALAADIGAVNTLKIGYGGLVSGYNTDYAGAMDALVDEMGIGKHELHRVSVAVLGAGGVGRALVAGLCDVGAKVTIYNRTVKKARGLADEFGAHYASIEDVGEMDATVVINCTSIGMSPGSDKSPAPAECFRPGMIAFDTVYNPLETLMLKYAAAADAKTISGAEMFVRQAMAQYKIFTDKTADEDVMRKTVFGCLS